MKKREIELKLKELAKQYPVVTITGPRQSGKTTLVKKVFKDRYYVNLEHPEERDFAIDDPQGFLNRMPNGGIIDEIQRVPKLLSYIQVISDEKNISGLFILTGSNQFKLMNSITQSLAGRTALLKLLPFSLTELNDIYNKKIINIDSILYNGFYPRLYDKGLEPYQMYSDYFETYVERDLRQILKVKNINQFKKFIKLLAGRIGQLLNLSSISNDLGISHTTIREWTDILQTSYIIFLLEPFYKNIKKRLIKTPKIYFYDVGLASFLLGMEDVKHISNHPLRGNLFENLIIADILKNRFNNAKKNNLNFYRDNSGNEVDLIYNISQQVRAIEIKSSETINNNFFKGLNDFEKTFPEIVDKKILIYGGSRTETRKDITISNIFNMKKIIEV